MDERSRKAAMRPNPASRWSACCRRRPASGSGPTGQLWRWCPCARRPRRPRRGASATTVRALSGRLSGLSVFHSKSVFYGAFVWVRRALNVQKWRFLARAVAREARAARLAEEEAGEAAAWEAARAALLADKEARTQRQEEEMRGAQTAEAEAAESRRLLELALRRRRRRRREVGLGRIVALYDHSSLQTRLTDIFDASLYSSNDDATGP